MTEARRFEISEAERQPRFKIAPSEKPDLIRLNHDHAIRSQNQRRFEAVLRAENDRLMQVREAIRRKNPVYGEDDFSEALLLAIEKTKDSAICWEGRDLAPWLIHVSENLNRNRYRSKRHRTTRSMNDLEFVGATYDREDEKSATADLIDELLGTLDDDLRQIIELHYFDGLTYAKVGEVLEMSPHTVAKQCRSAIARLQRRIKQPELQDLLPR